MAGMIYEFIDGLKAENKLYNELIALAESKRTHIIKGDIAKIGEINGKEEEVVLKIKGLERKRNVLMADIASILNEKTENVTITQIAQAMKNQPAEAEALSKIKDALTKSLKTLKIVNDENMQLINQSLEYAEFSINVLQSRMGAEPMTANYGDKDEKRAHSFFDTKQ